jgi:CheY-like chemotaxis protein
LLNILSNAIKYTKAGSINLSCRALTYNSKNEIKLLFKVKDTGIGIKSEDLQKLFTPFTQLHDENIGIASTGLGLVISKHLVELMNGQIWCESEFGVGSTFFFTVILRKTNEIVKPRKEIDYNESFAIQFPMSILIVEDNIINQMVITNHLKRFGYTNVKCVDNGKKAAEIVQNEDFDLIFMDIHMPIMNGLESTRSIRSLKLKRQPCIYALTASSMRSDQVACEKAGMDGLISKPIDVKQLVRVLKKAYTKMEK